jgi:hypothetical protein
MLTPACMCDTVQQQIVKEEIMEQTRVGKAIYPKGRQSSKYAHDDCRYNGPTRLHAFSRRGGYVQINPMKANRKEQRESERHAQEELRSTMKREAKQLNRRRERKEARRIFRRRAS